MSVNLHVLAAGLDIDADELRWMDLARCAETDPEAFFPEKGESTRQAKSVCRGCEVRAKCLAYALENNIQFGVWGGQSAQQRQALKTDLGRAA